MEMLLHGYEWTPDTVGAGGGSVHRLQGRGKSNLYLKYGQGPIAREITDEMVRLQWLAGRIPVPEVCHFVASRDAAWLLMSELPGRTAYQVLQESAANRVAVVDALVDFLRLLHALPIEACPFNGGHRLRLVHAQERAAAGLIDEGDFNDEHAGWTAAQILDHLSGLLPMAFDAIVTHGDFSLDNILMDDGEVVGLIDVGRLGVADRYQDLAILWNRLGEFGPTLQQRMFTRYGIASPDERKLRFHITLDECF